jgi:hypothetical protein
MKKKLPPPTDLANDFLICIDGILRTSQTYTEKDVVRIFNLLDDESKSYVINHVDSLDNSILSDAVSSFKERLAINLVNLGWNINHYNCNGKSVLILAVQNKLYSLIDALIEKGVDVDYARLKSHKTGEKFGSSALMFAAEAGDFKIVKKLVDNGADVNYTNEFGHFPLIYSINTKNEDFLNCFSYIIDQPHTVANKVDMMGMGLMEMIIKYGNKNFLIPALDKGAYNQKVYERLCDEISRDVGTSGKNSIRKINSKDEMLELLSFATKYNAAKELSEELSTKPNSPPKKIKI